MKNTNCLIILACLSVMSMHMFGMQRICRLLHPIKNKQQELTHLAKRYCSLETNQHLTKQIFELESLLHKKFVQHQLYGFIARATTFKAFKPEIDKCKDITKEGLLLTCCKGVPSKLITPWGTIPLVNYIDYLHDLDFLQNTLVPFFREILLPRMEESSELVEKMGKDYLDTLHLKELHPPLPSELMRSYNAPLGYKKTTHEICAINEKPVEPYSQQPEYDSVEFESRCREWEFLKRWHREATASDN